MPRTPRLGKFRWKISYLPYIGAVDPGTGERFGAEWGEHESFFEDRAAAKRRFAELSAPDIIERAELNEIVPQPRGGWALRLVDEWRDDSTPRRANTKLRSDCIEDRPCAAPGLTSYRYRGGHGWIMIGARDDLDAFNQAKRSLSSDHHPDMRRMEVWDENSKSYVPIAKRKENTHREDVGFRLRDDLMAQAEDCGEHGDAECMEGVLKRARRELGRDPALLFDVENVVGSYFPELVSRPRRPNAPVLSGRQIRRVAKYVLEEFPGLKMGPYARWRMEDGSFSYDVDRPYSTRAITFGWIVAGDFYAVPMEDEYRGETYEVRSVHTERELAHFIRSVVIEEAEWLGISVSEPEWRHPRLRPLSAEESRKHNLVAIPPRR